jgi:hypothetical protein
MIEREKAAASSAVLYFCLKKYIAKKTKGIVLRTFSPFALSYPCLTLYDA